MNEIGVFIKNQCILLFFWNTYEKINVANKLNLSKDTFNRDYKAYI